MRIHALRILAFLLVYVAAVPCPGASAESKYKTLHTFSVVKDGFFAKAGVRFDSTGNLYGTTVTGGTYGMGTVFELTPNGHGGWKESVLYSFNSDGKDGRSPYCSVAFDSAGNLYGTTVSGGPDLMGTVFELTPNGHGGWKETILHSFKYDGKDGEDPQSAVSFDSTGNIYGTTADGGTHGEGTVFELTPNGHGGWKERVLHSFNVGDGITPLASVILDSSGNLYGTTLSGGKYGNGTVFELSPTGDGRWKERVLHSFNGLDGNQPIGGVIFDSTGNLYGTTSAVGTNDDGTVFELSPTGDGRWKERVLYVFPSFGPFGYNPGASLNFDSVGNLYGTTAQGGNLAYCDGGGNGVGCGVVFKLMPQSSGDWSYRVVHRFTNRPGAYPSSDVIFDSDGNLYGTTEGDARETVGSVFEITP